MTHYLRLLTLLHSVLLCGSSLLACELCAVYSANNAQGEFSPGLRFTIAEQFVSAGTLQSEGESVAIPFLGQAHLESSYTHLVPEYNFAPRFGISLNAPIIYRGFTRAEILASGDTVYETGTLWGLGDISLIGRATLFQKNQMKYSFKVDLLAGIKFPTGDTDELDAEVEEARIDEELYGKDHPHGALGGIHQHDLTLGSGSWDGLFGISSSFRWKRWFINNQTQYYLRTEGHSYEFGDLIIISGGPGGFLFLEENFTVSLQANTFYETSGRDKVIGQTSNHTGMTAWYLGPLVNATWGEHFSAGVGANFPLRISNNGLQTVPDFRLHGVFSWRF